MNVCRKNLNKILVANRGEIAVRIIRTAVSQGYRTVSVFSEADCKSPHVRMADESVCIGPARVHESYLNIDRIIEAAMISGADAIHPGYGFLSENAAFAQACELSGITFIGPQVHAIELMGCKRRSKRAMLDAGVPCIPGYEGDDQNLEILQQEALAIGFPIMIKASAGGGGRGMRRVACLKDLEQAIHSARSEAIHSFGNGDLIIEKELIGARHIEIQVFGDAYGNVIHLGERDCSIQRRHQKVIEEAPSPVVSSSLRTRMGQAATQAAVACDYLGAGTVEFLLDDGGDFYFLEMNTRLQVEHPVTELVTGIDLVALQLQVASGDILPIAQKDVNFSGHAMEVRLYAEDPGNNFMPQTGEVILWEPAVSDALDVDIRVDSGLIAGQEITSFYDPMLAKLITFGQNREQARRRLVRLVEDSHLLGIRDNRAFLSEILKHPTFIIGKAATDFIEKISSSARTMRKISAEPEELALAAVLFAKGDKKLPSENRGLLVSRTVKLSVAEQEYSLKVDELNNGKVSVNSITDDWLIDITLFDYSANKVHYACQRIIKERTYAFNNLDNTLWLSSPNGNLHIVDCTFAATIQSVQGSDQVLATLEGVVAKIYVSEGKRVNRGDVVALIEAMKMEHHLTAPIDGKVVRLHVSEGEQVKSRQLLVQLEAEDGSNCNK